MCWPLSRPFSHPRLGCLAGPSPFPFTFVSKSCVRSLCFLLSFILLLSALNSTNWTEIFLWIWAYAGPLPRLETKDHEAMEFAPKNPGWFGVGGRLDRHGFYKPYSLRWLFDGGPVPRSPTRIAKQIWSDPRRLLSFGFLWNLLYYPFQYFLGLVGIVAAIGGTAMQLMGVYSADICYITTEYWFLPYAQRPMAMISTNSAEMIKSAEGRSSRCRSIKSTRTNCDRHVEALCHHGHRVHERRQLHRLVVPAPHARPLCPAYVATDCANSCAYIVSHTNNTAEVLRIDDGNFERAKDTRKARITGMYDAASHMRHASSPFIPRPEHRSSSAASRYTATFAPTPSPNNMGNMGNIRNMNNARTMSESAAASGYGGQFMHGSRNVYDGPNYGGLRNQHSMPAMPTARMSVASAPVWGGGAPDAYAPASAPLQSGVWSQDIPPAPGPGHQGVPSPGIAYQQTPAAGTHSFSGPSASFSGPSEHAAQTGGTGLGVYTPEEPEAGATRRPHRQTPSPNDALLEEDERGQ